MIRRGPVTNRMSLGRVLSIAVAVLLLVTPSRAYYQYIHYAGRTAPFAPIYEKYDLYSGGPTMLPNKTVTFFVSDQSPTTYGPNDSFPAVLSQVKQAIAEWNAVTSSDLRVAFGGVESSSQAPSVTPGGDVVFIDLPPGLLGMGGVTVSTTQVNGFFPVVHSIVELDLDASQPPGPSYLESYFTTAVHEVGHALGLQHTWTGAAMSQAIVRNTSRTRPLDADDLAGLSVLYGKSGWAASYGSITGRITYANGQPVVMASVVAISPTGPAVSALTDPNGAYRIDGMPANLGYLVYVHPLPPDALGGGGGGEGIRLPVDLAGQPFNPSGAFQTIFYPGILDPQQAAVVNVTPGSVTNNVNIQVQPRPATTTYDLETFFKLDPGSRSYQYTPNGMTVTPAFINTVSNQYGMLILQPPASIPLPQSVTILGGIGTSVQPPAFFNFLAGSPQAVYGYYISTLGAGTGPRHLVVNFGNDIYVLPGAVNLVQKGPPLIVSAAPNNDGTVTVTGAGFGTDSSVYFDGLKATTISTDSQSTITVLPPPGASGQTSTITLFNSDGQNSMILLGLTDQVPGQPATGQPQTYQYPVTAPPQISSMSVTSLPVTSSAAVDITTSNTNLVDGQVTVGFGSDDITVRRVWVLSPTHLKADLVVAPNATLGSFEVSLVSGFQVITQPNSFQILPAQAGLPFIALPIANFDPTQLTLYAGSIATVGGLNLAAGAVQLTLNGAAVQLQFVSPQQINFFVPTPFASGPATLTLNNGSVNAFPVLVQIDNPPPSIVQVTNQSSVALSGNPPSGSAGAGDLLNVVVSGLDPTVLDNPSRLEVTVSGVSMPVLGITPAANGQYSIQIVLTQSFGSTQVPVMVWVDGSSSQPASIVVR